MRPDPGTAARLSSQKRILHRWAVVGSLVIVQVPSMHRPLRGRVCEIEGHVLAVETDIGVVRVQRIHCRPACAAR